jgi:NAD(P)-dependent dehydrogenase (short-subunit alcohol dehydrogenase family)
MVEAAIKRYGRLDILDNNVGISRGETVVEVSEEQWDQIMTVNVKSVMLTSKYAIPAMVKSGGGSIINISSVAGYTALSRTPYSASKGAVIALTKSMAADHGKDKIRVNAIAPGLIYTPMVAPRMTKDVREERRLAAPLQVEGDAWDVAWAAVYLASDEARWVTGIVLPIDAGLTVTTPGTFHKMASQVYTIPNARG